MHIKRHLSSKIKFYLCSSLSVYQYNNIKKYNNNKKTGIKACKIVPSSQ